MPGKICHVRKCHWTTFVMVGITRSKVIWILFIDHVWCPCNGQHSRHCKSFLTSEAIGWHCGLPGSMMDTLSAPIRIPVMELCFHWGYLPKDLVQRQIKSIQLLWTRCSFEHSFSVEMLLQEIRWRMSWPRAEACRLSTCCNCLQSSSAYRLPRWTKECYRSSDLTWMVVRSSICWSDRDYSLCIESTKVVPFEAGQILCAVEMHAEGRTHGRRRCCAHDGVWECPAVHPAGQWQTPGQALVSSCQASPCFSGLIYWRWRFSKGLCPSACAKDRHTTLRSSPWKLRDPRPSSTCKNFCTWRCGDTDWGCRDGCTRKFPEFQASAACRSGDTSSGCRDGFTRSFPEPTRCRGGWLWGRRRGRNLHAWVTVRPLHFLNSLVCWQYAAASLCTI